MEVNTTTFKGEIPRAIHQLRYGVNTSYTSNKHYSIVFDKGILETAEIVKNIIKLAPLRKG